ncbi:HWE histidine kinase domain-containing protein [Lichenicoccus roseus]|uniref:histidine kinase n=1 Tax=Lichenicoccus roseus TaxID=2683649 RepID=A0A5R9J5W9_9PROT|nr:HWE histidine kinase domain-containing protein [Lichenicoccus roseus]TLU70756.1 GAF domain-containing protein [Lichenicoccus roseus]
MTDFGIAKASTDVTNCDKEPIHIPGAILPHGAMLVLDADTLEVMQAAGDTPRLLGLPLVELLRRSVELLFRPDQIESLRGLVAALDLVKPRHLLDPQMRVIAGQPLDASLHRSAGSLVMEFEAADPSDRFAADPLAGVQEMVRGFDESSSLQALCHLAAERVRGVARYDRVLVYRFMHDESGWVIAESREPHLEPFLDLHYPAADIPQQARALYVKNALRLITRVDYDPAPLTPATHPRTGEPLDMSQAILRDVSPIHLEYLRNMGIDASMSISIIRGGKLWGLIACHHYSPRILPRHLRAICELFGSMFSLQLEAREKGERFDERLASRTVLQNLMLNLASAEDYAAGLTKESPNLLDYIHGGSSSADGEAQGGVAVSIKGQLTFLGITPSQGQIHDLIEWLNVHVPNNDGVFSTDRLSEVWSPGAAFADVASGVLVISVSEQRSDFIIWFRPELVGTSSWAGELTKRVVSSPDGNRLSPRKSFEVWKETVRGRCLPWAPADLDAAFDLRVSLLHVVLRRINTAAQERKRVAERDKLLMAELDHRVKNTIANIQALVVQTSRNADSLTGFVKGLEGRIQAMAKAHSLLSQSRWEGVSIDKLLREELSPYADGHAAVILDGPNMLLTPKSALSLSLAIHELATNGAKYGAFSAPAGRVAVGWRRAGDGGVELSWTEIGGPLVEQPKRRGFGSTLIEQALAMETGGRAIVHYMRTGVVCDVFLPAASVSYSGATAQNGTEARAAIEPMATVADATPPEVFRILVVEDSFLLVMAIQAMIDDLGWVTVGPATRRNEALTLARSEVFDAALLDVNLDGETSWDVAAVLRTRGIPFVFGTGYDASSVLPDDLAGSTVLAKPYHSRDLENRLREVIAAGGRRSTATHPL